MAIDKARLLTARAMTQVDADTIQSGTVSPDLMARAGAATARLCLSLYGVGTARVFCGPGNNGGDGYITAQCLVEAGWAVELWCLGDPDTLTGDAAWAVRHCSLEAKPLKKLPGHLAPCDVFIDSLFGTGLTRPLSGDILTWLQKGVSCASTRIAMDLPSGVSADTGAFLVTSNVSDVPVFDHTVTFGAHKFGHVLQPGRRQCGQIWLADIGLNSEAFSEHASGYINRPLDVSSHPGLSPAAQHHKYQRGHVGVIAGPDGKDGAGALAAFAALRAGAGLVTIMARTPGRMATPAQAVMTAQCPAADDLQAWLSRNKVTTLVIGPGLGLDSDAAGLLDKALDADIPLVLDADALTIIGSEGWGKRLAPHMVITPHEGEFSRLFSSVTGTRIERFQAALGRIGAALVLKGPDTLIGRYGEGLRGHGPTITVNVNAPASLATAGSGDVLAGVIAGLWSPDVSPLEACKIGVHLHGLAAQIAGPGLYADALIGALGDAIARYKAAGSGK